MEKRGGGRGKGKSFKNEAQKNSWALMRGCIKLHVVCKPGMNEKNTVLWNQIHVVGVPLSTCNIFTQ
jgi:hypothetical protein